jgi:hypothetical protein
VALPIPPKPRQGLGRCPRWISADPTTGGPATTDRDRDGVDDRAEGAGTGAGLAAILRGVSAGLRRRQRRPRFDRPLRRLLQTRITTPLCLYD